MACAYIVYHGRIQRGDRGSRSTPVKMLYEYLEILVRTTLEKLLDPLVQIASWGRSVWPSVKYVDD